jgi:hypothetical protein
MFIFDFRFIQRRERAARGRRSLKPINTVEAHGISCASRNAIHFGKYTNDRQSAGRITSQRFEWATAD